MANQNIKYPPIKARTVRYCTKCRSKVMAGQIYYKMPYDTCSSCFGEVEQEQAYERYRLLQLRPNGGHELVRARNIILTEIKEGLHRQPFEIAVQEGELTLFTFIFRDHPTEEDGEEYVLATDEHQALSVLNDFYKDDEFILKPGEVAVKKADYRHPLHFQYEGIISVKDYIEHYPYPHLVGSTSPNMGLSTKILVGHNKTKRNTNRIDSLR
ncbi:hypothetical protein [Paenibacillus taichungensis]